MTEINGPVPSLVVPVIDPEAQFGRRLTKTQVLSVAAAALSERWGYNTIAHAFGLHRSAVIRMRRFKQGRYKHIHRAVAAMGKDEFVKSFLDETTINRIEEVKRLSRAGG